LALGRESAQRHWLHGLGHCEFGGGDNAAMKDMADRMDKVLQLK